MGLQVVLVEELPMEFWRKSRTKCVFERYRENLQLSFVELFAAKQRNALLSC